MCAEPAPLGLYVHLPWCVRKCPYCDFNSHALGPAGLPEADYVDALRRDLSGEWNEAREQQRARPFSSVFFGGGTPSLFSANAIGAILNHAASTFGLSDGAEITLEANPGAVEYSALDELRATGVNRLSMGAQSFDDKALARLGRVHKAHETVTAVRALRRAGFDNFNLDVMYALPEQSIDQALADLDTALALKPTHLSHYQLTLEPNTLFHHDPPPLPDVDTAFEMHQRSLQRLDAGGFEQYEVSAYANAGLASQHNLNYWRFGDYVGVGAGAHGKITVENGIQVQRSTKTRHPKAYLNGRGSGAGLRQIHTIAPGELPFEYALNQLRLKNEPLSLQAYGAATGADQQGLRPGIERAQQKGLLKALDSQTFCKTELGWRFLNDLQEQFLER
ncbi:MAG: radical SAM family heme chaperone HemW [Gammaproteobacteria bacterium]